MTETVSTARWNVVATDPGSRRARQSKRSKRRVGRPTRSESIKPWARSGDLPLRIPKETGPRYHMPHEHLGPVVAVITSLFIGLIALIVVIVYLADHWY
jgi:hypothetical protein